MRLKKFALCLLLAAPVLTLAEDAPSPSASRSRPEGQERPSWPEQRGERPERGRGERSWRQAFDQQPDWKEVQAFFEEHSPNRWRAFCSLNEEQKQQVRRFMTHRYRGIQWLQKTGAASLLELKKRQIRLEDDIYGLRTQLLKIAPDSASRRQLESTLKARVGDLVDSRFQEREQRILQLKSMVAAEEKLLEKDRSERDQLIDRQYQAELAGGSPDIMTEGPSRSAGGAGGPGGTGEPRPPRGRDDRRDTER